MVGVNRGFTKVPCLHFKPLKIRIMNPRKKFFMILTGVSFIFALASFNYVFPDRPGGENPDLIYQTTPGFWSYVFLLIFVSATVYFGYKTKKAE
jgi:hypothetical protein